MEKKYPVIVKAAALVLFVILAVYALIMAREFLFPIALSILLAYLLYPAVNFLEKRKLPRILAILICLLLAIAIIVFTGRVIVGRLNHLLADFPALREKAIHNIDVIITSIESTFGISDDALEKSLNEMVVKMFDTSNLYARKLLNTTTGTIFRLVLLPVLVFLVLFYRTKFAYFILKLVSRDKRMEAIRVLKEISKVATRYMGGVVIVVSILCVVNSVGLFVIGLEYPVLLGMISAFFSFIPSFGSWIGASIPLLFSLFASDNPLTGLKVIALYAVIHFVDNYFLTPNIVGGNVNINPLFIILSLIAGAMIWGVPGMLVIVPYLAMLRIGFQNIKGMEPYAYLLSTSGTRKHALTRENIRKFIAKRKNKK